jgi:hypothetical protein
MVGEWKEFKCIVCEQTEERCVCPKYCALCREACDYKTQDQLR